MDNIYDKAHELAAVLKNNEDVVNYREAVKKIEADPVKKNMVTDFRNIQIESYQEQVKNGKLSDESRKKFENLVNIIQLNPEVADFLNKEQRFSILFDDIMKILNEALDLEIPGSNTEDQNQ